MRSPIILVSASLVRLTKTSSELASNFVRRLYDFVLLVRAVAMSCGLIQPHVHLGFEHVQRQGTVVQQFIVKTAKVESRPKPLLRLVSDLGDLSFSDLVR